MNDTTCACGAAILRARTPQGMTVSLEPEPSAGGNVVVEDDYAFVYRSAESIQPGRRGRRYREHRCQLAEKPSRGFSMMRL